MNDLTKVNYYLQLPSTVEIHLDAGGFFASVIELPGCITQADTLEELDEMIEEAMSGWIEIELEDGAQIPEPQCV